MVAQHDLREIRSEENSIALRIFLQRSALKLGVEALVLVDESGTPVAWSDDSLSPGEVGTYAAKLFDDGRPIPGLEHRAHRVWLVNFGDEQGYLFSLGHPEATFEDVQLTCAGITRILTP